MKDIEQREEIYFKELMSGSKLEMPFSDFEDHVMREIEGKLAHKHGIAKEIKLSWLFFIAGSIFGILISWTLQGLHQKILGMDPKNLAICFQIVFIVVFYTQIETLLGFLKRDTLK